MTLYFQHGINLNHIHDTQAAHSLNKSENKQISYIDLSRYYGFSVSKISKGKNNIYKKRPKFWEQRPLSETMITLAYEYVKFSLSILEKQSTEMAREDLMLFQKACKKEIQFLIRRQFNINTKSKLLKLPEIVEIQRNQLKKLRERESTIKALTAKMPIKKQTKNNQNKELKPKWDINWKAKIQRMKENMQLQESAEDVRNYGEIAGITRDDIEMFILELKEQHNHNIIKVNYAIEIITKQLNQLDLITEEESILALAHANL